MTSGNTSLHSLVTWRPRPASARPATPRCRAMRWMHTRKRTMRKTDPENPWGNVTYPPIGGAGGGGNGGGGSTGSSGSWGGGSSSSYATGKAAFDKMEADIKSGNMLYYKAEIVNSKEQLSNTVDIMSNVSNITGLTDNLLQIFEKGKNSVAYQAVSETMAHLGVGISLANTFAVFVEKEGNLSIGDWFIVAGDVVGVVSVYAKFIPAFGGPVGSMIGSVAGVYLGIAGKIMNDYGVYYIEMPDGRLLRLTPLSA